MARHIFEAMQGVKETMIPIVYHAAFWTTSRGSFVSNRECKLQKKSPLELVSIHDLSGLMCAG